MINNSCTPNRWMDLSFPTTFIHFSQASRCSGPMAAEAWQKCFGSTVDRIFFGDFSGMLLGIDWDWIGINGI